MAHKSASTLVAKECYIVTTCDGVPYAYDLELHKFENTVFVHVYCDDEFQLSLDYRYLTHAPTADFFHDWSIEWLRAYVASDCKIERSLLV